MPDDEIVTTEPEEEDPTPDPSPDPDPDPTPDLDPEERTVLDDVKLALRLTTDAYDPELTNLINSGLADLGIAGVIVPEDLTDREAQAVTTAVITYVKVHFGSPSDYDRLKASYDEQKAQLGMATGYTDWGDEG